MRLDLHVVELFLFLVCLIGEALSCRQINGTLRQLAEVFETLRNLDTLIALFNSFLVSLVYEQGRAQEVAIQDLLELSLHLALLLE